jgi:predicted nucleic acid-binding Zn ribbon protein
VIYDMECKNETCDHKISWSCSVKEYSERKLKEKCPKCSSLLEQDMSKANVPVVFKGEGWTKSYVK